MEYKDELKLRLIQYGIEPTEDIIRFIDLETIPLKAMLFKQSQLLKKINTSLRNGGYDPTSEFGKLFEETNLILNK